MFKTFYQQEKYPNCKFYFFYEKYHSMAPGPILRAQMQKRVAYNVVVKKEGGEVTSADDPLNGAFRVALYNADAHGCCE